MRISALLLVFILCASASTHSQTDDQLLDTLQHTAFNFFWNQVNTTNGLVRDRDTYTSPASIASTGFGLSAICTAIDHGWITRDAGRNRILTALRTFWLGPQGSDSSGMIGYKGFFYHFLDMTTARRFFWGPGNGSELSTMDTGLLLAGILDAKQYFSTTDSLDGVARALADSIYRRVDWEWMRNSFQGLPWAWSPDSGSAGFGLMQGYNEGMITQILALGSPTHAVPSSVWSFWTSGYSWQTWYGYSYVNFPPLFGHQYSHCWLDFRSMRDAYMTAKGITYFENSRRATLAQRQYCIQDAPASYGYTDSLWGLTACDGPAPAYYVARGAPPAQNDDGTIAPTAAAGSIPFAPDIVVPVLRNMYNTYHAQLWTNYGFRDAFNLSKNWWDTDVIGIDEGPIILMIENYRAQAVWNRFMQDPDVQQGLTRAGFSSTQGVRERGTIPATVVLSQNYPNPFNGSTTVEYYLPGRAPVRLLVFDMIGRSVASYRGGMQSPGLHTFVIPAGSLASGVYSYTLEVGSARLSRRFMLLK